MNPFSLRILGKPLNSAFLAYRIPSTRCSGRDVRFAGRLR